MGTRADRPCCVRRAGRREGALQDRHRRLGRDGRLVRRRRARRRGARGPRPDERRAAGRERSRPLMVSQPLGQYRGIPHLPLRRGRVRLAHSRADRRNRCRDAHVHRHRRRPQGDVPLPRHGRHVRRTPRREQRKIRRTPLRHGLPVPGHGGGGRHVLDRRWRLGGLAGACALRLRCMERLSRRTLPQLRQRIPAPRRPAQPLCGAGTRAVVPSPVRHRGRRLRHSRGVREQRHRLDRPQDHHGGHLHQRLDARAHRPRGIRRTILRAAALPIDD